jgi:hypothetical protein
MYQPSDRVNGTKVTVFRAVSGTIPDAAMENAYSIFKNSDFNRKVLITLTDGDWQGDKAKQEVLMNAVRSMDVATCLVEMTAPGVPPMEGHHGHEFLIGMSSLDDLPKLATKMVDGLLRQSLA